MSKKETLFPALLKYWRNASGLSQLDLALTADVSARHVSFLETGRAKPSEDMVLRLAAALDVPFRERNSMLTAAGFEEAFDEPGLDSELNGPVRDVLERMLSVHDPFPMVVMNQRYDVLMSNKGGTALLASLIANPEKIDPPFNAYEILFDPNGVRPFVQDWERVARGLMSHLHIESLKRAADNRLSDLVDRLLTYPDVPKAWRTPDFSSPMDPAFTVHLKRGDLEFRFLTTATRFNAPANITLEEARIESYFPVDEATEAACRKLVGVA